MSPTYRNWSRPPAGTASTNCRPGTDTICLASTGLAQTRPTAAAVLCCCADRLVAPFGGLQPPDLLVELRGFEPLTPSMRTRCATGLRYSPESGAPDIRSRLPRLAGAPLPDSAPGQSRSPKRIARERARTGFASLPGAVARFGPTSPRHRARSGRWCRDRAGPDRRRRCALSSRRHAAQGLRWRRS